MRERRLILVRHAKADYPPGVDDHDRPLTERGARDARGIGAVLPTLDERSLVLVSTALRAQQTWAAAGASLRTAGRGPTVRVDQRLYGAVADGGRDTVLDIVRAVEDEFDVVVVVAHNPGMQLLAAVPRMRTASAVCLAFLGSWRGFQRREAVLSWHEVLRAEHDDD